MEPTIGNLQDIWHKTIDAKGGHCVVCGRWGKTYKHVITRARIKALLWLCAAPSDDKGWIDVPNSAPRWLVRTNSMSTLKFWGLIERKPVEKGSKTKHSGLWRPTHLGRDFANGQAMVPKEVFTYNDHLRGISSAMVKVTDCFDSVFDYQETMNSIFKG